MRKLAEHDILSLRCAMKELGYQWKRDETDRSSKWQEINHWELFDSQPVYKFHQLNLHPVVSCGGDLCTTYVACGVRVHPDQSLDGWLLIEQYAGSHSEFDAGLYSLEDLPNVLHEWMPSWQQAAY